MFDSAEFKMYVTVKTSLHIGFRAYAVVSGTAPLGRDEYTNNLMDRLSYRCGSAHANEPGFRRLRRRQARPCDEVRLPYDAIICRDVHQQPHDHELQLPVCREHGEVPDM